MARVEKFIAKAPPIFTTRRSHGLFNILRQPQCIKNTKLMPTTYTINIYYKSFPSIGIFESPKCDVNPQPNTRGIGPLVGRTSGNRRSVMHDLVEIFSVTYNFSFICQYIFIWLISSGREIFPLLKYPSKFLIFEWTTKIWAQVRDWPL